MNTLIDAKNLCKYFDQQCVNANINLTIPEGSIFGLLGPNGAGKTTLIRMLATVTQPDDGEIWFQGEKLQPKHIAAIGYMPEERGLYKKMSVVDQLLFFAELKGIRRSEAKERVKYWLYRLEIVDWANKKMEELSKGMAQKIQFISTIIHKPKFLILDEPFSGFDPVNADIVKELILELKQQGCTILFSTHRMDNVDELCDQLAIIHKGHKILDGKIDEIRRSFFRHQYLIEIPSSESLSLPTVISEKINTLGNKEYLVQLTENDSPTELIQSVLKTNHLIGFQQHIPTIHQIFVQQVTAS